MITSRVGGAQRTVNYTASFAFRFEPSARCLVVWFLPVACNMVAFYRLKTSPDSQYYKRASDVSFSAVNEGLIETTTSHGITHIAHAKGEILPLIFPIFCSTNVSSNSLTLPSSVPLRYLQAFPLTLPSSVPCRCLQAFRLTLPSSVPLRYLQDFPLTLPSSVPLRCLQAFRLTLPSSVPLRYLQATPLTLPSCLQFPPDIFKHSDSPVFSSTQVSSRLPSDSPVFSSPPGNFKPSLSDSPGFISAQVSSSRPSGSSSRWRSSPAGSSTRTASSPSSSGTRSPSTWTSRRSASSSSPPSPFAT